MLPDQAEDGAGTRRPAPKRDPNDPWEQVRNKLHAAAMQHSKEELRKRWEELEWEYKSMDPASRLKHCVMPSLSGGSRGTSFAVLQEQYGVWNKLSSAISRESLFDLKQALDHAANHELSDTSRAILFTYCDALTRHHQAFRFTTDEVVNTLERGAYEPAIDMVVDIATSQGANVGLLLTWLTRLCADWNAGMPPADPPGTTGRDAMSLQLAQLNGETYDTNGNGHKTKSESEDLVGSLVGILQTKASRHARLELNRAWDELDSAYAPDAADPKGGLGPDYKPFSKQEELFYIRNKIVNAIHQQNLVDLRRAISYALAFGLDPKTIEIEAAYRDALAKHQQEDGFSPNQVRDSLDKGDWWTTLDIIVRVALARGTDKNRLQRVIETFQSRVSQQSGYERSEVPAAQVTSV